MADGGLYVMITSVLLMQMFFVEWQAFQELSAPLLVLDMVVDMVLALIQGLR